MVLTTIRSSKYDNLRASFFNVFKTLYPFCHQQIFISGHKLYILVIVLLIYFSIQKKIHLQRSTIFSFRPLNASYQAFGSFFTNLILYSSISRQMSSCSSPSYDQFLDCERNLINLTQQDIFFFVCLSFQTVHPVNENDFLKGDLPILPVNKYSSLNSSFL